MATSEGDAVGWFPLHSNLSVDNRPAPT